MTTRYRATLEHLAEARVEFVVVGGVAAVLQGAPIVTFDLDIVQRRTPENVGRLLEALERIEAHYRGDPRRLRPSESVLMGTGRHLLNTSLGPLDVLGAVGNGLGFEDLIHKAVLLDLQPARVPVLDLATLIAIKEVVGRPKDLAVLPTLRATLEESERRKGGSTSAR